MPKRGENIYKRKDGRWEARLIKGYDEQGKAKYAYFYGRTYSEVKNKMLEPIVTTNNDSSVSSVKLAPVYFNEVADLYLECSKVRLKESSYVKYYNLLKNHIRPYFGAMKLQEITSEFLNNFVRKHVLSDEDCNLKCLSVKTIKDSISVIKSVLKFAKENNFLEEINVNIVFPKVKPVDIKVLSVDEQLKLEKFLCDDMDKIKLGIYVCLYTGLRIGEICSLRWSDISLKDSTLTVSRTMQRIQTITETSSNKTKIITTDPKSNCSIRTIPIPNCLVKLFQDFQTNNKDSFLLTGEEGYFIEPRTYQYQFKRILSQLGLENISFHTLRHTFATRCIALGFEVKSLSEILGHSSVNITLDRYVHPSFEAKRNNMNKLTGLVG